MALANMFARLRETNAMDMRSRIKMTSGMSFLSSDCHLVSNFEQDNILRTSVHLATSLANSWIEEVHLCWWRRDQGWRLPPESMENRATIALNAADAAATLLYLLSLLLLLLLPAAADDPISLSLSLCLSLSLSLSLSFSLSLSLSLSRSLSRSTALHCTRASLIPNNISSTCSLSSRDSKQRWLSTHKTGSWIPAFDLKNCVPHVGRNPKLKILVKLRTLCLLFRLSHFEGRIKQLFGCIW